MVHPSRDTSASFPGLTGKSVHAAACRDPPHMCCQLTPLLSWRWPLCRSTLVVGWDWTTHWVRRLVQSVSLRWFAAQQPQPGSGNGGKSDSHSRFAASDSRHELWSSSQFFKSRNRARMSKREMRPANCEGEHHAHLEAVPFLLSCRRETRCEVPSGNFQLQCTPESQDGFGLWRLDS